MNCSLQQQDSFPPPYPKVSKVRSLCQVTEGFSAKFVLLCHRHIIMSETQSLLAKLLPSWWREGSSLPSKKMECPHGHSLLAPALPSEAGLASLGQGAAPINKRWNKNRPTTLLHAFKAVVEERGWSQIVLKFLFLIKALYLTGHL